MAPVSSTMALSSGSGGERRAATEKGGHHHGTGGSSEKSSEKGGHRERGSTNEKGGTHDQWCGGSSGGEWFEKGTKGASRGVKGGSGKGKGRAGKCDENGRRTRGDDKPDRNAQGSLVLPRPLEPPLPPPPVRLASGNVGAHAPPFPGPPGLPAPAAQEGEAAAQTRAKDEVFAEIRKVLEGSSSMQQADFDFHVRQHLHALYGSGGKERLREALSMLQTATAQKERQAIKKWPAYLLTLLKRFDSDLASQDREARARARVAAAASNEPKALPMLHTSMPHELIGAPFNSDPFNFESPLGGSGAEPWAAWGAPQPQSPVAAR